MTNFLRNLSLPDWWAENLFLFALQMAVALGLTSLASGVRKHWRRGVNIAIVVQGIIVAIGGVAMAMWGEDSWIAGLIGLWPVTPSRRFLYGLICALSGASFVFFLLMVKSAFFRTFALVFYWMVIAWAVTASSMQFGFTWEMAGGMMIIFFSPVAIILFPDYPDVSARALQGIGTEGVMIIPGHVQVLATKSSCCIAAAETSG